MKIKLIFWDWKDSEFNSVYQTLDGSDLANGKFHSGSTFDGIITLDKYDHKEFKSAMERGFIPVFYVGVEKER